jgi:hypothetical protein
MKHCFEMTWDQVDAIVIEELQEAYRMNSLINYDEGGVDIGPDEQLLQSIKVVLQYSMPSAEYEAWEKHNG